MNQSCLKDLLGYSETTGQFVWLRPPSTCVRPGSVANARRNGYVAVQIFKRPYYAHRLAWLYMTGEWPTGDIDHINGDRADNRWINLRDVSKRVNKENVRIPLRNNKLGVLGVSLHQGRFRVCVGHKYIGMFESIEAASAAHLKAKRILHAGCTL